MTNLITSLPTADRDRIADAVMTIARAASIELEKLMNADPALESMLLPHEEDEESDERYWGLMTELDKMLANALTK